MKHIAASTSELTMVLSDGRSDKLLDRINHFNFLAIYHASTIVTVIAHAHRDYSTSVCVSDG